MLIKNIEDKIKLALFVSVASMLTCIIIVIVVMINANNLVKNERQNIYVLDAGLPLLVQRATVEENEEVEGMSHVNMFHSLFFNLPPDDKYIQNNIIRAMYLIDESGISVYNDLREQGFYNKIVANSTLVSVKADSIFYDVETKKFRYVGTERIERPTSVVKRMLISEGNLRRVKRSENNPHGFIIYNYKVLNNDDIEARQKKQIF
ncbi:MAG: conjugative transposon protein TraK [Dysgonamonadaceae bacterium]|jgi:conjugative transposon TraK protein|nr:conjugative transposon protein TraK [Dysgonamonadaceae bacterium]